MAYMYTLQYNYYLEIIATIIIMSYIITAAQMQILNNVMVHSGILILV